MQAATFLSLAIFLSLATTASSSYVYKIVDGQCGESKISKRLVGFAVRFSHVSRGRCKDQGYTVHVGSTTQKSKSKFARQVKVELYTKPSSDLCTKKEMAPLSRACNGVQNLSSKAVCGTPCFVEAQKLHSQFCIVPGVGETTIDTMLKTCAGYKKTSTTNPTMLVGFGKRCAIDFCKTNDCPKCASGLSCKSNNPSERCSGACFGTCRKEHIKCNTCAQLGWKPEGGGSMNVCAESDDGFDCTNSVNYAKAAESCALAGARLCTAKELISGEGRGTGCGHDFHLVWSSSSATTNGQMGVSCKYNERVAINVARPQNSKCLKVGSNQASMRCCADTVCSSSSEVRQGGSKHLTDLAHMLLKLPAQFSTLTSAVKKANLLNTLMNAPGPFTLIAPTNQAFKELEQKQPGTLAKILSDKKMLARLLEYHIISGNVKSYELKDGMKLETVMGASVSVEIDSSMSYSNGQPHLYFHGSAGLPSESSGWVTTPDMLAKNGVAHGINGVLLPPPIKTGAH